ncbi:MAG TPA: HAD hydrolase family protein, partial [Symbiobacteriaceae bacterium]|nr:HAD hydrolase family protein [Symbiobacteriaceae bacterium]
AALRRAMAAGVTVAIATGRLHGSASIFGRRIGINGPVISSNGALVRDLAGKTWRHRPLPASSVAAAMAAAAGQPDVYVGLFHEAGLCTLDPVKTRFKFLRWWSRHIWGAGGLSLFLQYVTAYRFGSMRSFRGLPDKIFMSSDNPASLVAARNAVLAAVPESLTICNSDADNLEFTADGVTKGEAVTWLAAHYGISLSDVMVAGDSQNDLPMFELDCHRVAMGNAEPNLKERASFVTASNDEDGVAMAVERLVLGEAAV